MPANNQISQSTTQLFLDLYDITNDFIILGDGAVSLVLTVSALNFGLLSENEQDATIYSYAALLNSLSFPIEIVIRSQPKDVTGYLKLIHDQEERTTNPIYKQKISEYRSFVESLVQEQNVLDKKFYIVIPFSAVEMGLTTQSVIPGAKNKPITSFEKNYIIEKAKTNLYPRRDHLIDQLARIGLYSRQLTTQELIQMLYSSYNPESFEGQKVTDTSHYTTPLVQAKIQGEFMNDTTISPNMPAPTQPKDSNQAPTSAAPSAMPGTSAPEVNKTNLGYTTPNMNTAAPVSGSSPTPSVAPAPLGSTSMPSTPAASINPTQPASTTPPSAAPSLNTSSMPPKSTSLSESPVLSTPVDKTTPPSISGIDSTTTPVTPSMPSTPSSSVDDPQNLINQTLGQIKAPSPSVTPGMPQTPTATSTPAVPSVQPKIDN